MIGVLGQLSDWKSFFCSFPLHPDHFSLLISCHITHLSCHTACLCIQKSNKNPTMSLCLPQLIMETGSCTFRDWFLSQFSEYNAIKTHPTHMGFTDLLNFISKLISQVVLSISYITLCSRVRQASLQNAVPFKPAVPYCIAGFVFGTLYGLSAGAQSQHTELSPVFEHCPFTSELKSQSPSCPLL